MFKSLQIVLFSLLIRQSCFHLYGLNWTGLFFRATLVYSHNSYNLNNFMQTVSIFELATESAQEVGEETVRGVLECCSLE